MSPQLSIRDTFVSRLHKSRGESLREMHCVALAALHGYPYQSIVDSSGPLNHWFEESRMSWIKQTE